MRNDQSQRGILIDHALIIIRWSFFLPLKTKLHDVFILNIQKGYLGLKFSVKSFEKYFKGAMSYP